MQQSRQKLTEFETTMAFVIGGGLTLLVFAFALGSVRGNDADFGVLNIMALLGTLLMVVGTAVWAISNKVWLKREDFSKALYVGHEHDHHEEAPAAGGAAAGAHAGSVHHAPKAEPEIVAPATEAAPVKDIVAAASVVVETPKVEVAPAPVVETVASAPVSAPVVEIPKVEELAPVVVETPKAEAVPEAIQAKADDLETIEGIGPKSAAALYAAGVTTFAHVATLSADDLEHIIKGAGVRLVARATTWPQQAKLAAEGHWDELKALQDELNKRSGD